MKGPAATSIQCAALALLLLTLGCGTRAGADASECPVDQCPMAKCICDGGGLVMADRCRSGPCLSAADTCRGLCPDGLQSATAVPDESVKGSPECDAYCNKMKSMSCATTCNEREVCWNDQSTCPESVRANLKCIVDTGSWEPGSEDPRPGFTGQASRGKV